MLRYKATIIILTALLLTGCGTINLPQTPCRHIARMQWTWATENGYDARIQRFKRVAKSPSGTTLGYDYHAACYIVKDGAVYWGSQKWPYEEFQRLKCPYGIPIQEIP